MFCNIPDLIWPNPAKDVDCDDRVLCVIVCCVYIALMNDTVSNG